MKADEYRDWQERPAHAGLAAADFIERDKFFRMGRAPVMVDILPEISGVDFDRAWQRRVEAVIDPVSGLTASFISSEDLIASKLAAGRPQDIADVAALRNTPNSGARVFAATYRPEFGVLLSAQNSLFSI